MRKSGHHSQKVYDLLEQLDGNRGHTDALRTRQIQIARESSHQWQARGKPLQVSARGFHHECRDHPMGKRQSFQPAVLSTGQPLAEVGPIETPCAKANSVLFEDLNVGAEVTELLEESFMTRDLVETLWT